ncbi:MAG: ribonuclease [Sphingomonadaceae bacterium]|nr:ribonuclease [Sphingomonadaceae bacterium]
MRALFEHGIGCDRAVVVDGQDLIEAHLELPGVRAGDVWRLRLKRVERGRGWVDLDGEALIDPLPAGAAEGGLIEAEVVREPIADPDRRRAPKLRALGCAKGSVGRVRPGPMLRQRLAARGLGVTDCPLAGPDRIEAAGWSEALEQALCGEIGFPGGRLLIERTAAFEAVIDIDGHLPPADLARAAARATAAAIRRLDLAGAIVVDMPTVGDPAARREIGDMLDARLPRPFERTAMNGFGLVQIIRPRLRASLMDLVQADPVGIAALQLLRAAEREPGAGVTQLTVAPVVERWLTSRPALGQELARRTGRPVRWIAEPALPMSGGHVFVG